ncbi:MAG: hypothetical protein EZS28_000873, partial [Streblomastix strix]
MENTNKKGKKGKIMTGPGGVGWGLFGPGQRPSSPLALKTVDPRQKKISVKDYTEISMRDNCVINVYIKMLKVNEYLIDEEVFMMNIKEIGAVDIAEFFRNQTNLIVPPYQSYNPTSQSQNKQLQGGYSSSSSSSQLANQALSAARAFNEKHPPFQRTKTDTTEPPPKSPTTPKSDDKTYNFVLVIKHPEKKIDKPPTLATLCQIERPAIVLAPVIIVHNGTA